MELMTKQGYRQTEVGMIPNDWNCKAINEVCKLKHGFQFLDEHFTRSGVGVVKIGNLEDGKGIKESNLTYVSSELANRLCNFLLSKGDVLMALTGGTLGKVSIMDLDYPLLQNYRVGNFIPHKKLDKKYLHQILTSFFLKNAVKKLVNEAAQPNFGKQDFDKLYVPIPPTLQEQKAIATALSDMDDLISSLEKLIAKKKAIKLGAMQRLLTPPNIGGQRLPGFNGDWVEKQLGDISEIKTGSKNNQDKVTDGRYPFYVRSQSVERINSYSYDCEAILVPGEGGIGSIFHYINGKFEVHQRVYKVSNFKPDVIGKYVFFQMKHSFGVHALTNTVKATVDSLRLPTFQDFIVPIPRTLKEQKVIAQTLSDIDSEIEEMETKKRKYQFIKQGMMQELLTGKTRLI